MPDPASDVPVQQGLSLRDYLALNAPAVPEDYYNDDVDEKDTPEVVTQAWITARWSYDYADAMLEERKRVKP